MTFQPYQEAGEEMKKQSQLPLKLLKQGTSIAAGIVGGGSLLARVFPLLNKFVPMEITKKGLDKIDSRYGKFFKSAEKLGHTEEEAKEFLAEKIKPGVEEEEGQQELQQPQNAQDAMTMNIARSKERNQGSELSRDSLNQQFDKGQPNNTDDALLAALSKILQM